MSIAITLSSALSGLTAAGRAAQTVSNNVANVATPGYAVRRTELASSEYGGVTVTGVSRREDPALLSDLRQADAATAGADQRATAARAVREAVGPAGSGRSLGDMLADLDASLIAAASRPSSEIRLAEAVKSATRLSEAINRMGDRIQAERLSADRAISHSIERLDIGLRRIDALNDQIAARTVSGSDANTLRDQRQAAIDSISELVPLRILNQEQGRVGLMSEGGQILLNDRVAEIEFAPASAVDPFSSPGAGLSALTIDGRDLDLADPNGRMAGGSLEALFDLRDTDLVARQNLLDAFALELGTRFQAPGLDPTTAAGAPGIFSDSGAQVDAANTVGLSQRISLNPALDPTSGEVWRLRAGLAATSPGFDADATILNRYVDVSSALASPIDPKLGTVQSSLLQIADRFTSNVETALVEAENRLSFSTSRSEALREALLSDGVNTDEEMQRLLLIEQAYAANARVVQVAGGMIDRLLEI